MRHFLLTAILTLLAIPASEAQQIKNRKDAIGLPSPQAMRVQVVKGQTVRITLSCTTVSKAARVEYVIRDFPALGVVGTLLPTPEDRTKATIIYQSARQSKGKTDMFSFYARYHGGHFSAPVQIVIELSDPEARIKTPSSIDFGSLILGDTVIREVLLENTGNIEFRKQILLPDPLHLVEPADGKLTIPAGDSAILKIKYHPEKIGAFTSRFIAQDEPGITFIGNASAPFITSTDKLSLVWNERKLNRQAELQVTNNAKTPISIQIHPPVRTQHLNGHPPSNSPLILSPGKSGSVTIALPKEDVRSFKGILEISTAHYTRKILIESTPTPPRLQIDLPDPSLDYIDFGVAAPGEMISRTFMLKNTGGTASLIGMGALPPFQIILNPDKPRAAPYTVSPESSAAFTVNFVAPPKDFGNYSDNLKIGTDVGTLSIPLTAIVNNPNPMTEIPLLPRSIKQGIGNSPDNPSANTPLPTPSPLPPLAEPGKDDNHLSPTGFYTRDSVTRKYLDSIPAPSEFKLHEAGRHELTLAWKLPAPDYAVFEVEIRRMLVDQKTFHIESVWAPFHNINFNRSEGMVYATIKDLHPASIYEFRVLTVGTGGYYSQPSKAFGAWTKPQIDLRWLNKLYFFMGFIAIGLLLRWYWKKHDGSIPMPTYWPRTIRWPFE